MVDNLLFRTSYDHRRLFRYPHTPSSPSLTSLYPRLSPSSSKKQQKINNEGSLNSLIFKLVNMKYGTEWSYFLDNGNNVFFAYIFFLCISSRTPPLSKKTKNKKILYLILSTAVVAYKLQFTDDISKEQRQFPQTKFRFFPLFFFLSLIFREILRVSACTRQFFLENVLKILFPFLERTPCLEG